MDDLISRQAVLEATSTTLKITGKENAETVYGYIKNLCDDIKALPSVDAVEVVRCKDCKYFELNHWDGIIITAHEICNKWADGCKTNKDGYCFLGERKTDDS